MWQRTVWSPIEIEYLKTHPDTPVMQLCIALAKTKGAIKKKQGELSSKPSNKKKCLPGNQGQRSKIGKRKDCNNMFFRSGWEANLYRFLREQMKDPTGELSSNPPILIEYEPHDFTFWQWGVKKGTVSYTPDFKVTYTNGQYEWIEVKGGWLKGADKTKIRRFAKYYPEEFKHLVAVTPGLESKTALFFKSMMVPIKWVYLDINRRYKKLIDGWE
jgi:hypothetical protein